MIMGTSTATATRTGRFMTAKAKRYQKPSSSPAMAGVRGIFKASMRFPMMPMRAGRSVRESTTVPSTTRMPPLAMDCSNIWGKKKSPKRLAATVTPEKATARPVVMTVVMTAVSTSPLRASSSR